MTTASDAVPAPTGNPPPNAGAQAAKPPADSISLRGAGIVSLMTLISRILGFFRDRLFVQYFGSGPVADAFILAFTIPNLLRRLFGEGALSSAFIPVFVESLEAVRNASGEAQAEARRKAWHLANVILTRLAVLLSAVSAATCIGAAAGAMWVFHDGDVDTSRRRLTLWLLALMMPYAIFINSAAIIGGILNAHRRFTAVAFAPVMLNVLNITTLWFMPQILTWFGWSQMTAADEMSGAGAAYILSISVLLAGVAQVAVLMPSLYKCGFVPKPAWSPDGASYHRVVKNFIPLVLGLAVFQINTLLDRLMADFLVPGSGAVTSLYIGNQLMQLPLALIATAMGTAALPTLSRLYARQDMDGFKNNLLLAFRQTFFLTVPAAVGLYVLAYPLIDLAFGTGNFATFDPSHTGLYATGASADPVARAALVMQMYAPGLVFFSVNVLLTRAFYAMHDTKTPLKISLVALAANVIGNYTLIVIYRDQLGEAALALSSSISGVIQTVLLCLFLFRKIGGTTLGEIRGWLVRTGFAVAVGWIVTIAFRTKVLGDTGETPDPSNAASNFLSGFVMDFLYLLFSGVLIYTIYSTWFSHYRVRDGKVVTSAAPLISLKMIASLMKDQTPEDEREQIEYRIPRDVLAMTSITWTVLSSAIMGLFIWHLLHSLPAGDRGLIPVRLERGLAPLLGGMLCYWMVASTLNLPEYHSWMQALLRKRGAKPAANAADASPASESPPGGNDQDLSAD